MIGKKSIWYVIINIWYKYISIISSKDLPHIYNNNFELQIKNRPYDKMKKTYHK